MKLETFLTAAWLASTATAIGPSTPEQHPRLAGKASKMANWRWTNPFTSPRHKKFSPACEVTRKFEAREFLLDDLSESQPLGLLPYRDALKSVFSSREYPGSWDGIDPHGYDRNLLMMNYADMPLALREWIEEQERTDSSMKGLFAVYGIPLAGTRVLNTINVPQETPVDEDWRARDPGRVAIFAPGAVYEVLPLFVAEGSGCEDPMLDLAKYSEKLVDGGVVGFPVTRTKPKRDHSQRDMEFEIKAQVLKLNEGEDAAEDAEEVVEKTEKAEKAEAKSAEKDEL